MHCVIQLSIGLKPDISFAILSDNLIALYEKLIYNIRESDIARENIVIF